MPNSTWKYKLLKASDLPTKAQCFIELMDIDISELKLIHLEADPDGDYIKSFAESGVNPYGNYSSDENKIYFIGRLRVGVIIHEKTHFYLDDNNEHDTKTISENYIKQYGASALTEYASFKMLEAQGKIPLSGGRINWEALPEETYKNAMKSRWDEVVCEIVATYGRRGQFDKIKELFNKK